MNQILLPKVFQEDIKHERTYFLQLESVCLKHSSITKSTPYNISNTLAKLAMKIYLLNRQKPDRNLNHKTICIGKKLIVLPDIIM